MKDLEQLFYDFKNHLMTDVKPSYYFNQIFEKHPIATTYPFTMLSDLKKVKQSPKFHPEGNVWNHTMLVIDNAAIRKNQSHNPEALMWASLLHDIGKTSTTKILKGRITAYNHDKFGEKMAAEFLSVLKAKKELIYLVSKMVRWHMQILFVIKELPFADIKTMLSEVCLEDIALLSLCDRLGRGNMKNTTISDEEKNVQIFIEKCMNHSTFYDISEND